MKILFDVLNIYYIPQYYPIWLELQKRGHECSFVVYSKKNDETQLKEMLSQLSIDFTWVFDQDAAKDYYLIQKPDWIFFGNEFPYLNEIHQASKTVQLGHGIGPKPSYYNKSNTPMTVRFVEGDLRIKKLKEMYPNDTFIQTGFSKLDPIFNNMEKGLNLEELGLDPKKKTILYAPTFNPTSIGCFPNNWPKEFSEYNILVKVHSLTLSRERYKKDQDRITAWAKYSNVYVAAIKEFSLVPFLKTADILVSEASSTLFEFAALNKPVVICDFYDLKWSYKGLFKYRFKKRFGESVIYDQLGAHASKFKDLKNIIKQELHFPSKYENSRHEYNRDHVGPTDGNASQRIADYLEKEL
ncbi:hypothetical protein BZG02_06065 [Labilibaculum filiforme]|uniref:CDP-glycerol--poly(Glycerophosphate) glycerophosphotransferase n=1 Tax=Labilibaculum filiforme TaxID=1940526 RepID=A0A2N3I255_9BACT|nr:CDP-glycerol glycerophosphotransferase family protein [Labilibaculum filiforme]PKQ64380.1 hypothetical protein BZG02_06065 [Labilibaculum filiforme]